VRQRKEIVLAEGVSPSLPERLREATADLHRTLESSLGLATRPIDRQRIVRLLMRFLGFHLVWEPTVAAATDDRSFMAPRRRVEHLRRDLGALGVPVEIVADPPLCLAAGAFDDPLAAWGSVYVLEGATLGGRVISRTLEGEAWLPAGGVRYFDPYGAATGRMWQETRAKLAARSTPETDDRVIAGARLCFEQLAVWLCPGTPAPTEETAR
jgi:heme oxygenase